jgi:hypothetical protein
MKNPVTHIVPQGYQERVVTRENFNSLLEGMLLAVGRTILVND